METTLLSSAQTSPTQRSHTARRALDLFGCLLALPLLCLTALGMAVVTAIVSPGPVIFRQRRIGHRGREFMILKFRTMHVGADAASHHQHFKEMVDTNSPMVKLDARHDTRLLPGGWLLRASGLDELPQFINILRGEMSLVGPRPCLPTEFDLYQPAQRARFDVLPGLTGLWQVSGKNLTTFDEMIRFDIQYARRASLLLNLKIILLTPWALLAQINDIRRRRQATAPAGQNFRTAFAAVNGAGAGFTKPAGRP